MNAILSTKNHVQIFDERDLDAMAIEFVHRFDFPPHIRSIDQLAEYLISKDDHLDITMQDGILAYRKPTYHESNIIES